jgi:hypothetical protein
VQGLAEVKFSSPDAATYHALKHGGDLPPSEVVTNLTTSFLDSAQKTIKSPTADPNVLVLQNGARSLTFTRVVQDGATKYQMRAIVIVSPEGNVVLATMMGAKVK